MVASDSQVCLQRRSVNQGLKAAEMTKENHIVSGSMAVDTYLGNAMLQTTHSGTAGMLRAGLVIVSRGDVLDLARALTMWHASSVHDGNPVISLAPSGGPDTRTVGRFHIYFNRHGAAGRPWCIAAESGAWELAVKSWSATGVPIVGVYVPKATPDYEDVAPSAWIAVEGVIAVSESGHAIISDLGLG